MAEKFDEFSKHVARRHSRRGLFKFLGAGVLGAFTATIFTRNKQTEAEGNPITNLFRAFIVNDLIPPLKEHQGLLNINGALIPEELRRGGLQINGTLLPEDLTNPIPWWERFNR